MKKLLVLTLVLSMLSMTTVAFASTTAVPETRDLIVHG